MATERSVRLYNVSRGGALIDSAALLQRDSLMNVTLESDRRVATLRARVCHIRQHPSDEGYLVGLEFVEVEPTDLDWLVQHDAAGHVQRG